MSVSPIGCARPGAVDRRAKRRGLGPVEARMHCNRCRESNPRMRVGQEHNAMEYITPYR